MKFQRILLAALAMMAFVGCEQGEEPNDNGDELQVYTISVDKDTIEANGLDVATFTVTDQDGNDLTTNTDIIGRIYFVDAESGEYLPRKTRTFSSISNGVYTFYATVRGTRSQNTVTVTVQNRAAYEMYQHKVCIYQCTGTWCGYCPLMTAALTKVRGGKYGDNTIVLACHASSQGSADPYSVAVGKSDLGNTICYSYGGTGFPYAAYDLAKGSLERSEAAINALLSAWMITNPATCGVKISKAQINADGTGVIEASIKADKGGTYDMAWAVLADNQPSNGGVEEIYHDVVQAVSGNFLGMSDESKVTLKAGEEYSKTFEIVVPAFKGVELNPADLKVVVLALNEQMVDNANICAAGSSVDYLLN